VCEGARLILGYPHIPELKNKGCSPGYKHSFPYFNEWPPMGRTKSAGWDAMTLGDPPAHGRFDTYGCVDTDCTTKDTSATAATWRMQDQFADSGSSNGPDTVSVLEYTVTLQHDGAMLFSFTSDGELGFDYLKFFINDKELSLSTKYREPPPHRTVMHC